ncbi:MAG: aminotransferase class I/II-fold pyridoxal phosphate-dependent enzyme, partial [Desulfitobacterium hafniense]|nr:aminotransferase class I/II-fold pyridoxal phosphate-dependent enzyme [Desulfitobacterium hafniense]
LLLAEGKKVSVPLRAERGFLPDLSSINVNDAKKAKLFILNYPNNPTAAVAPLSFYDELVSFAREYNIIICHDAAYSELSFDGYKPASFLQAKGAKEVGIEFHSVSKTYNLAGARLGFVVGNSEVISVLAKLKANIDYGVFAPVLSAGAYVLKASQEEVELNRLAYQRRRDIFIEGCSKGGWDIPSPKGSMFIWAPVPTKQDSLSFAISLANETGVIVVPGIGFGDYGEGYVRIALVQEDSVIQEAVSRIQQFLGMQD